MWIEVQIDEATDVQTLTEIVQELTQRIETLEGEQQ